jgi:hypothetical protein
MGTDKKLAGRYCAGSFRNEKLWWGELRDAVEETAQYAEKLLDEVRNRGTIAWPAFLQRRVLV